MPQTRDKELTRARILTAAFGELHRSGYQAADLEAVAEAAGVTRGTLYYHFGDKEKLAEAVVREMALPLWGNRLLNLVEEHEDPIEGLIIAVRDEPHSLGDDLLLGCPINTLAQEVSTRSEPIRTELDRLYTTIQDGLVSALERGKTNGFVASEVESRGVALFFVASTQGMMGMVKALQSREVVDVVGRTLIQYLEGLRPQS